MEKMMEGGRTDVPERRAFSLMGLKLWHLLRNLVIRPQKMETDPE